MKLKKFAACTFSLFVMPVVAMAQTQSPSTRPIAIPVPVSSEHSAIPQPSSVVAAFATSRPSNRVEWDEMMKFLNENSPLRARALSNLRLPENAPMRQNMLRNYQFYKQAKDRLPEVAELRKKRFQVEDRLFGLAALVRRSAGEGSPELRREVHNNIETLVNLGISEHELRIKNLQSLLNDEQRKLEQEKANEQTTVSDRTNKIMEQARRPGTSGRGASTPAAPNNPGGAKPMGGPAKAQMPGSSTTRPDTGGTLDIGPPGNGSGDLIISAPSVQGTDPGQK
ncbi:MAG: hypothetical protein M3O30_18735 [Planctomycetota bacterium]|nr:hypothetical protein [Planctomycetota bacterium]